MSVILEDNISLYIWSFLTTERAWVSV